MHKEHITFMFVPENKKHPFKVRMTTTVFRWLLALASVLFVVFVIGVFMGGKSLNLVLEKRILLAENQNLRKQLSKVERIEYKLAKIEEMEKFMRRMLDQNQEGNQPQMEQEIIDFGRAYFTARNINTVHERSRYIPTGLPQTGALTSRHGGKSPLYTYEHSGVDIALPAGKAVYATAAGKVVFADFTRDLGFLVVIDHTNGYITRYGHLKKTTVDKDDFIDRNTIVGFSGATGKSIGTHIHYEVLKDGVNIDPLESHKAIEGEIDESTS